jgi:hypothetical protein
LLVQQSHVIEGCGSANQHTRVASMKALDQAASFSAAVSRSWVFGGPSGSSMAVVMADTSAVPLS